MTQPPWPPQHPAASPSSTPGPSPYADPSPQPGASPYANPYQPAPHSLPPAPPGWPGPWPPTLDANRHRKFVIGLFVGMLMTTIGGLVVLDRFLRRLNDGELALGFVVFGFFGLAIATPLAAATACCCIPATRRVGAGLFAGMALALICGPIACLGFISWP